MWCAPGVYEQGVAGFLRKEGLPVLEAGSFRALRLWSLQLRYRSQSKGVSQFPELRIPDANAHTSVFGFYLEERLARVLSVSSPAHAGGTRVEVWWHLKSGRWRLTPISFPGPHACVSRAMRTSSLARCDPAVVSRAETAFQR